MKLRKQATSIVLIVAAIAVAIYAWFWDRGRVTDVEREQRVQNVLPAFRRAEVTRVEIVHAAPAEKIVLERGDAGAWTMTSPRTEPANVAAIDALLRDLETATRVRRVDGAAPMPEPRARVTIAMGEVTWKIALGGDAPRPEGAAYLRVEGEPAIVVRGELASRLLAPADAYREKTISPYSSSEIAKLSVSGVLTVERGASGDFLLTDGTRASQGALEKVWGALGEMRAESFLDDAEADRLVASPAYTIEMTPRDGRPRGELLVGGACPGHDEDVVVVRRAPTRVAACAPKGILLGLAVPKETLADRRLFSANADDVTELRIKAGANVLDLARSDTGWHVRLPQDRTLAQDEVDTANALVLALSRAEGTLLERAPSGAATASVTFVRGDHEERVDVRARDGSGALVQRAADGAMLRVSAATARLLEPRASALRSRDPWGAVASREVLGLSLHCGVAQEISRAGSWKMTPAMPVDAAGLLDVANAILRAKAEAWVADADDGFGFADAKCSAAVTIADDGGSRKIGIVFGGDADGGVYAHVDGEAAVFVVSKTVRDAAKKILVDRNAVAIDLAGASSITLSKKGARVDIAIAAGHPRADAGVEDALATLRAAAAVHLGPPARDEGLDAPALEIRVGADAGAKRIAFGAVTTVGGEKMYFARTDGIDATFVVPKATVDAILGAF